MPPTPTKDPDSDTLFEGGDARITQFSVKIDKNSSGGLNEIPRSQLVKRGRESIIAEGKFRMYKILKRKATFLQCGKFVHPILPRLKLRRLSESTLVFPQPNPGMYWRIQLLWDSEKDVDKLEGVLSRTCNYENCYKEGEYEYEDEYLSDDSNDEESERTRKKVNHFSNRMSRIWPVENLEGVQDVVANRTDGTPEHTPTTSLSPFGISSPLVQPTEPMENPAEIPVDAASDLAGRFEDFGISDDEHSRCSRSDGDDESSYNDDSALDAFDESTTESDFGDLFAEDPSDHIEKNLGTGIAGTSTTSAVETATPESGSGPCSATTDTVTVDLDSSGSSTSKRDFSPPRFACSTVYDDNLPPYGFGSPRVVMNLNHGENDDSSWSRIASMDLQSAEVAEGVDSDSDVQRLAGLASSSPALLQTEWRKDVFSDTASIASSFKPTSVLHLHPYAPPTTYLCGMEGARMLAGSEVAGASTQDGSKSYSNRGSRVSTPDSEKLNFQSLEEDWLDVNMRRHRPPLGDNLRLNEHPLRTQYYYSSRPQTTMSWISQMTGELVSGSCNYISDRFERRGLASPRPMPLYPSNLNGREDRNDAVDVNGSSILNVNLYDQFMAVSGYMGWQLLSKVVPSWVSRR